MYRRFGNASIKLLFIGISIAAITFLPSCDYTIVEYGFLAHGKVYEWVNAPSNATSMIYIQEPTASDSEKALILDYLSYLSKSDDRIPLEGAIVKFIHSENYTFQFTTDANGEFNHFTFGWDPDVDDFIIEVTKPGYIKAVTPSKHGFNFYVVAVLVKDSKAN